MAAQVVDLQVLDSPWGIMITTTSSIFGVLLFIGCIIGNI